MKSMKGATEGRTQLPVPSDPVATVSGRTGKQNVAQLTLCWLYGGPGLIAAGKKRIEQSAHLLDQHSDAWGAVLHLLYRADQRIPFSEIVDAIPGVETRTVLGRLRDIDGVLFLDSEPAGLSLSIPLREELTCMLGGV